MKLGCSKLFSALLSLALTAGMAHAMAEKAESAAGPAARGVTAGNKGKPEKNLKVVDINHAGKAELMTLRGIDAARADKIIAGRPYLSKAFLVTKNVIPAGVYQTIKNQIIAKQQ